MTAFFLATASLFSADLRMPRGKTSGASCLCPGSRGNRHNVQILETKILLIRNDEYAALESVQLAADEVADGSSYNWRRGPDWPSGIVEAAVIVQGYKRVGSPSRRRRVERRRGNEAYRDRRLRSPDGIWQLESRVPIIE